jgi:glycosyltransferase involved in cell wall biosynthesis
LRAAAVVLTKNEEARIGECLRLVKPHVSHLLVLDESDDRTAEIARGTADRVVLCPSELTPKGMAERKNYAWRLVPKWCRWVLFLDADERFDPYWLSQVKKAEDPPVDCLRFPRLNLPHPEDTYPDYQVRYVRNESDFEWRNGEGLPWHEVLYSRSAGRRLDQLDRVVTMDYCPILHLPRRADVRRPWW